MAQNDRQDRLLTDAGLMGSPAEQCCCSRRKWIGQRELSFSLSEDLPRNTVLLASGIGPTKVGPSPPGWLRHLFEPLSTIPNPFQSSNSISALSFAHGLRSRGFLPHTEEAPKRTSAQTPRQPGGFTLRPALLESNAEALVLASVVYIDPSQGTKLVPDKFEEQPLVAQRILATEAFAPKLLNPLSGSCTCNINHRLLASLRCLPRIILGVMLDKSMALVNNWAVFSTKLAEEGTPVHPKRVFHWGKFLETLPNSSSLPECGCRSL